MRRNVKAQLPSVGITDARNAEYPVAVGVSGLRAQGSARHPLRDEAVIRAGTPVVGLVEAPAGQKVLALPATLHESNEIPRAWRRSGVVRGKNSQRSNQVRVIGQLEG